MTTFTPEVEAYQSDFIYLFIYFFILFFICELIQLGNQGGQWAQPDQVGSS